MFSRFVRSGEVAAASYKYTGTWYRFHISAPTCRAMATQSSMVTPSIGINGTTSAAPILG